MSCPGPRIVFLIDRYQGDNEESLNSKIIANINLSCLRILSYYKHFYCMHQVAGKSSISWGYKFFNSSQEQSGYLYRQFKFLDYATHNFDKFENELYEGIEFHTGTMNENKMKAGDKLKVALTEIITDFQWDQPELFSPGKGWTREENDGDRNLLFLFTALSDSFDVGKSLFNEGFHDSRSFIKCLFPHVLYEKFVSSLKIRLLWIDTGTYISNAQAINVKHRDLLENAMRSIGGSFVEMIYLSSWWIWRKNDSNNCENERKVDRCYIPTSRCSNIHTDITSVSSLVKGLLDNMEDDEHDFTCYTLCYGFLIDAVISLSSISLTAETTYRKNVNLSIHVTDVINPRCIELNTLSVDTGYFYVLNTRSSVSNRKLSGNLCKLMVRGELLKIRFIPPQSCTVHHAVLIPASAFAGTIIVLSDEEEMLTAHQDIHMSTQEDDENDIHEELEGQLRHNLRRVNRDLGMSLANLIDTWFLSHPKLGFPLPLKNILNSLCGAPLKKRKREESSKALVEYLKGIYGKHKIKQAATVKFVNGVRICPARRRLLEFRKRQNEDSTCGELCEENKDEIVKTALHSPTEKTSVKPPSPTRDVNDSVLLEYEKLLQDSELCFNKIGSLVDHVTKYYKCENEESYVECSLQCLCSNILKTVEDIRDKNIDNPKEHLIKEYLLQVHLYFEVVYRLNPPETDNILNTVVSFLRTVLFEESTVFVMKHLNEKVLTQFPDLTEFLRKLYDDLMLVFPDELDESNESDDDDVSLVKSVGCCRIGSHCSSENSPYSLQPSQRTLKRIPSILGDNASKKVITVQVKKPTTNNNRDKSSDSSDKVVKRTLFTQNPPASGILTTPKAQRRKSESSLKKVVPDTPEGQQLNNMMWKKLERKRRHSCIDKKMVTIEESPLKEIASPIKRKSSFYRSNSFNCHTSPRRFYTLKRHPTMIVGSHAQSSTIEIDKTLNNRGANHNENKWDGAVSASPMEVKLRRRSTLFSNFDTEEEEEEEDVHDENQCMSEEDEDNEKSAFRRKIFDNTPVKEKPENFTFKLFGTNEKDCKRRKLSLEDDLTINYKQHNTSTYRRAGEVCDITEPQFMSATTVDWLREIEKEQSKTPTNFHDAFASMFPDTTTPPLSQKSSPAIVKAGSTSIKVSPCLSASSIECLENAPIISPVIERKGTRRKGKLFNL